MTKDLPFHRVFSDHDNAEGTFPGFLLVNHGRTESAAPEDLAWSYAQNTLRSIEFGLENAETPEAAFPALYSARHTLELYLKGLVPDWENLRGGKNRHHIDYLVDILHERLEEDYDEVEVGALSGFLKQFAMLDPKGMAFRYRDGAVVSFGKAPLDDPEIWVDFVALREALTLTFEALDKVWRKNRQTEAAE